MIKFDAIIIGAGPAGMMAAIRAQERNRKILLVERNNTPGKKLRSSGKGRCNLTNSCDIEDFLGKFSQSRSFLRNAFAKFFNADLMAFFEDTGLKLKKERGGRVFPESDRSGDVLAALKDRLKNKNIKILLDERVRKIVIKNKKVEGILTYSDKHFLATNIVIATGGLSYPKTGSTGDGYRIAEKLGHSIIPLKPALSPILIKEKFIKDWQGISLKNKNDVEISINFKPALDHKKLDARLLREFNAGPGKSIKNIFKNLLPQGIIVRFLERCRIDPNKSANQITTEERKRLIGGLFDFRLTVLNTKPVKDGIVTRGGVNTKEINPKTMESRLVKGLFFTGEVIDIDAKTGGYNMQAAFSTGWVCGDNI